MIGSPVRVIRNPNALTACAAQSRRKSPWLQSPGRSAIGQAYNRSADLAMRAPGSADHIARALGVTAGPVKRRLTWRLTSTLAPLAVLDGDVDLTPLVALNLDPRRGGHDQGARSTFTSTSRPG